MIRTRTILFAALVALLALAAGVALRLLLTDRATPVVATELGAPFELVDQSGASITEAAFTGRPSLLFFGFTHCPEVCPTTIYEMDAWLDDLGATPEEVGTFFVTVDPERDTVEYLQNYLASQSDRITGITGEPEAVWDMARSWRIYWQKRPLGDGDYTLDHFASVFVLDEAGRVSDLIAYGADAEEAKAKIAKVLR
ncbi:SCO family protein [uncultured Jannaschia sp.]|uniref:SCO family protein n=1 Tax=uncultured Jannaschia sp. TaxID=293347 RepID=UPI00260FC799|nr:SCO family protein [uncultured Jannaschia sp.]